MENFQYNDGGRAAAGFKGKARDCVTRAVAIATGKSYRAAYELVDNFCYKYGGKDPGSARTGVPKKVSRLVFEHLGFKWVPTMKIGQGCKVHARASELPSGTIVIAVSRHVVVVKDGVFHDTFDATRGGRRCVYGYWYKPTSPSPVMI